MSDESMSNIVGGVKDGNSEAQQRLWDVYFEQIVAIARNRLRRSGERGSFDGEDVALSVFESLFRRAEQGQYPDLQSGGDLWKLLKTMAKNKAINRVRDEKAAKRGGGKVIMSTSQLEVGIEPPKGPPSAEDVDDLANIIDDQLGKLDGELQTVALMKLQGFTNREIATEIGRAESTVERRLGVLRSRWTELHATDP